jgi:hypothetical protein
LFINSDSTPVPTHKHQVEEARCREEAERSHEELHDLGKLRGRSVGCGVSCARKSVFELEHSMKVWSLRTGDECGRDNASQACAANRERKLLVVHVEFMSVCHERSLFVRHF